MKIQLGGRRGAKISGFALVDARDFERINKYCWRIDKRSKSRIYARTQINKKTVMMHRLVMNFPKGKDVDHANCNGLDNRRKNLRICTRSQNLWNQGKQKSNTSGHKGVRWYPASNKWRVELIANKKRINVGYFVKLEDAVLAYKHASKKYHGEFGKI